MLRSLFSAVCHAVGSLVARVRAFFAARKGNQAAANPLTRLAELDSQIARSAVCRAALKA